jgi:F-type H+-transporting ATPase subunit epsilon
MTFRLTIAAIDDIRFYGEAQSVTVPGREGEMTILASHEPLLTTLRKGTITVKGVAGTEQFEVTSGTLEVTKDEVYVLL